VSAADGGREEQYGHIARNRDGVSGETSSRSGGSQRIARNPGMPLDLGFLESMRSVNRSALERRVGTLTKRRSIKNDNQAAWLLRAIALMDLTTLNSNDTDERVRRLCAKAINPLRPDMSRALGIEGAGIRPAAVCVYHPSWRRPSRR
jgi:deoxyribose-phosphate aldolase